MIYEMRTYTTHYGKLDAQLKLWSEHGLPTIAEHFGYPILVGVHEDGDVNSFSFAFRFDDVADRARKRETLATDERVQKYLAEVRAANTILQQQSRILTAPRFFDRARAATAY